MLATSTLTYMLTGSSVFFEVLGLALVVFELTMVQRRDLGTPVWMQRMQGRLRRLLRRPQHVTVHAVSAGASVSMAGDIRVWRGVGPDQTLEQRVVALEANLEGLRDQTDRRHVAIENKVSAVSRRVDDVRADVQRREAEREQQRVAQLRQEMALQWWGTGLFVLGAVLGGLANLS